MNGFAVQSSGKAGLVLNVVTMRLELVATILLLARTGSGFGYGRERSSEYIRRLASNSSVSSKLLCVPEGQALAVLDPAARSSCFIRRMEGREFAVVGLVTRAPASPAPRFSVIREKTPVVGGQILIFSISSRLIWSLRRS